ncbi:HEAT repeat domain-containing protein [Myroides odoratus]|uniref:HEAT repeat domain-containing protein n=1 Tax=Myroides odoratus TaxID=256 RepID=UPI0039AFFBB5
MVIEANKIKSELAKVGITVNDIYDLVNTDKPYPAAVPVLLDLLQEGIEHIAIKEGVIRALAVQEAIGKASPILLDEYNKIPKDKTLLRWAIGNTIYITIIEDDVERILPIVQDKENGMSRQMFVVALGKVTSGKAEDVLIKLLDDDEVAAQALEALGRMKSKKAKDKISVLINHPKALIRKEALKALKKVM